ncbi:MAG TPA: hypothetical protein VNI20_01460 [Fimbriimonadaceae bacterium]|nr:hypothetical protein [Fimbriimonadaceae bacterium]
MTALLATASMGLAQSTAMGTKPDIVVQQPATSMVGPWDMVKMLVALLVVFALLKWALPKVVARMNKKLVTKSGSSITIEESASFGGGNLQIITARGRTLLICVTQTGVSCLADLTDSSGDGQEEPAFFEMVDKALVDVDETALDRLNRLTG